ncbi:MAG: putative DNA binding domain-containing protein [Magnetococcales bacterium]|nr:putative DNA binding domain-containing protein [Magnetococcales bacterium]
MANSLEIDFDLLRESWDCEAKSATGRDGRGHLPASVWETYSAMANTEGGIILLGVRERRNGQLQPIGIPDIERIEQNFWNQINDPDKVSRNLLRRQDVEQVEVAGNSLFMIRVPRAERRQRPIFLNGNPLKGTFVRRHDGDHRASDEAVRRFLAEAEESPRDGEILAGYDLSDLEADSLVAFRNLFRTQFPGHPFLAGDDREMLRQLGGWTQERTSGREGLTLAGLLMFGKQRSILDRIPDYHLDYQHLPEANDPSELRWIDRITLDGTWPGNLFEFFRKVVPRLRDGVRIPFQLGQDLLRRDDTPQHEALREALVNALIHADHTARGGIRVRRAPHRFEFVNPGTLRIPKEQVRRGGRSDCRNPAIQRMFQMIGVGEKAGSGFPRIVQAWHEQHWRVPLLEEDYELYETCLTLNTLSLLPVEVGEALEQRFPGQLAALTQEGRLALATAFLEGRVSNSRLQELTECHPNDLTEMLRGLVRAGYLESHGKQRWTWYALPMATVSEEFVGEGSEGLAGRSEGLAGRSEGLAGRSEGLAGRSEGLAGRSEGLAGRSEGLAGRSEGLVGRSEGLSAGSEGLSAESEALLLGVEDLPKELLDQAASIRTRGKVSKDAVHLVILAVCRRRYLSLRTLSGLLGRAPDYVRPNFLRELVKSGQLEALYPDRPNHPDQAYRTRYEGEGKAS